MIVFVFYLMEVRMSTINIGLNNFLIGLNCKFYIAHFSAAQKGSRKRIMSQSYESQSYECVCLLLDGGAIVNHKDR